MLICLWCSLGCILRGERINSSELLMILGCWVYVVYFGCFMCGVVGSEDWDKKCVFLVRICCGLTELEGLFEKCIGFNRGLLVVLLILNCCSDDLI